MRLAPLALQVAPAVATQPPRRPSSTLPPTRALQFDDELTNRLHTLRLNVTKALDRGECVGNGVWARAALLRAPSAAETRAPHSADGPRPHSPLSSSPAAWDAPSR